MTLIAKKVKLGLEDMLLGSGTEEQVRGDSTVTVTKIDTDWILYSLNAIKALDTTKIKHVVYVKADNTRLDYDYSSASGLAANDIDVLMPDAGTGRWLLRRTANQQTENTATGTTGAANSSHSGIPTGFILNVTYGDDTLTPGTGASYRFTGTTDISKATQWPAADGYYYDKDGKQFELYDTARLPTGVNNIATTTYTFVATDAAVSGGKAAVVLTNSAATTATVPPNSTVPFKIGSTINIIQNGEGLVTLVGGSGVTVNGGKISRGRYHAMTLLKLAENTWVAIGGVAEEESVPVVITLNNHTLTNTNALSSVALFPNGEMLTIDTAGGVVQPSEWCVPRVTDVGYQYEARLSKVSGDNINQGAPTEVWLPMSSLVAWGVQELGATLNFVGTLEIRLAATGTVLDSCTLDLTSTYSA